MFDTAAAVPFIISASLQVVATIFTGITTGFAESQLKNIENTLTEAQYSAPVSIPVKTPYSDFLPIEYRHKRLSALYSWSRDLALIFASGVAITITVFVASSQAGVGIKIACLVWWILVAGAIYGIYKKGYVKYADMLPRIWLFGPASIAVVAANALLVPAVGYGWLR
jgi:hypothetical protein